MLVILISILAVKLLVLLHPVKVSTAVESYEIAVEGLTTTMGTYENNKLIDICARLEKDPQLGYVVGVIIDRHKDKEYFSFHHQRCLAALCCAAKGNADFARHAIDGLKHERPAVRSTAVALLGSIGLREYVAYIAFSLRDPDPMPVYSAADWLAKVGTRDDVRFFDLWLQVEALRLDAPTKKKVTEARARLLARIHETGEPGKSSR